MSTAYAQADDEVDINDPIVMDDISDQDTSDVLDKARKVPFEIVKAEVRTQRDNPQDRSSEWTIKRLALQAKIADAGTDGEGANTGRVLFPEFILTFNKDAFPDRYQSDWWQKKARGPMKELLLALGFDLKSLPAIDGEFLSSLVGREFIADIQHEKVQKKTDRTDPKTGKVVYEDTGDVRNKLGNYRSAE